MCAGWGRESEEKISPDLKEYLWRGEEWRERLLTIFSECYKE